MTTRVELLAQIAEAKRRLAEMEAQLRTLDNYSPGAILRPVKSSMLAPFPLVIKLREVWGDLYRPSYLTGYVAKYKETSHPVWLVIFGDFSGDMYETLAEALGSHPDLEGDLVEVFVPEVAA